MVGQVGAQIPMQRQAAVKRARQHGPNVKLGVEPVADRGDGFFELAQAGQAIRFARQRHQHAVGGHQAV